MARYDIAIAGWGLLPALLCLSLASRDSGVSLLLLSGDAAIAGDDVEPVVVAQMSPAALSLVDPYRVSEWPGYFIARDGSIEQFNDPVWLLDPMQVWLDLIEREAQCTCIANCTVVTHDTGLVRWTTGEAQADRFIDLSPLTDLRCESEIMGMEAVRHLGLPILADCDTASDNWEANQLLPLGDERVLVRKLPKRLGLVASYSNFTSILNALVED